MTILYVLQLENKKYYIGCTKNNNINLSNINLSNINLSNINLSNIIQYDNNIKWIKINKPLKIIEICSEHNTLCLKMKTIEYMKKYGWKNVRGYIWSNLDLDYPPLEILYNSIAKTSEIIYNNYKSHLIKYININKMSFNINKCNSKKNLHTFDITIFPYKYIHNKQWKLYSHNEQKNKLTYLANNYIKKFDIREIEKTFKLDTINNCINYHSLVLINNSDIIINNIEKEIGLKNNNINHNTIHISKLINKTDSITAWNEHVNKQYVIPKKTQLKDLINKKILILDLETIGLPQKKDTLIPIFGKNEYYDYTDNSKYDSARVIQIAWIIINNFKNIISYNDIHNYLIKPNYDPECMNSKALEIHGIEYETAVTKGYDFNFVTENLGLEKALLECDIIMGHNCLFDIFILLNECYRYQQKKCVDKIKYILDNDMYFCTGNFGRNICKLKIGYNKFYQYRMPKLKNLYYHYFNKYPLIQHDARDDVFSVAQIFNYICTDDIGKEIIMIYNWFREIKKSIIK
jgi:hypothetical protein